MTCKIAISWYLVIMYGVIMKLLGECELQSWIGSVVSMGNHSRSSYKRAKQMQIPQNDPVFSSIVPMCIVSWNPHDFPSEYTLSAIVKLL